MMPCFAEAVKELSQPIKRLSMFIYDFENNENKEFTPPRCIRIQITLQDAVKCILRFLFFSLFLYVLKQSINQVSEKSHIMRIKEKNLKPKYQNEKRHFRLNSSIWSVLCNNECNNITLLSSITVKYFSPGRTVKHWRT